MVVVQDLTNLADHNKNVPRMKPTQIFKMEPVFAKVYSSSNNQWRSLVHRIIGTLGVSPNGKFNCFKMAEL